MKTDIERIQNLLEQNKKRLQRDFEQWFVALRKEATAGIEQIIGEAREQLEVSPAAGLKPYFLWIIVLEK